MRVISKRPLVEFYGTLKDASEAKVAKEAMDLWYAEAERAKWANFAEVRRTFPQTDLVSSRRGQKLVFDIKGNHYRIVCVVRFDRQALFVLFAGRHEDYDKLNIEEL